MFSIAETTWPTSTPSSAIWDGAEQNWLLAKHQRWTSLMLLWFNGNTIPAARLVLQHINGLSFGIIVLHKVIGRCVFHSLRLGFFPPNFWMTLSLCFKGSQCQNVGKLPADSVVVMSGFPHIFDHCAWSKLRALDGTAMHNLAWVGECYVIPGSALPKHLMPSTVSPRLTMKWLSCQMQLLNKTKMNNIGWCKYWILKVSAHHHVS